ncbi:unnamed protein product [Tetraodon nigroviridis]|uniref:(spotted green pufferfish) hypothetical protein n=1 Tax=Tetraodon nigroviridis TaxID=99883 RepID=Q4SIT3_TETNG|nr:unnamed protein product [Tetraodon nigroviridis]
MEHKPESSNIADGKGSAAMSPFISALHPFLCTARGRHTAPTQRKECSLAMVIKPTFESDAGHPGHQRKTEGRREAEGSDCARKWLEKIDRSAAVADATDNHCSISLLVLLVTAITLASLTSPLAWKPCFRSQPQTQLVLGDLGGMAVLLLLTSLWPW